MEQQAPENRQDAAVDDGAEPTVEIYEPLEAEPPGPPVEEPSTGDEMETDARAPSMMPVVWTVLGVVAVALVLAFVLMSANPPKPTPVYQAATPSAAPP